jgi:hypothetical protein
MGGRRVATVGYSDDAEHYGSGIADVPVIVSELGLGSVHTGIGFCLGEIFRLSIRLGCQLGQS